MREEDREWLYRVGLVVWQWVWLTRNWKFPDFTQLSCPFSLATISLSRLGQRAEWSKSMTTKPNCKTTSSTLYLGPPPTENIEGKTKGSLTHLIDCSFHWPHYAKLVVSFQDLLPIKVEQPCRISSLNIIMDPIKNKGLDQKDFLAPAVTSEISWERLLESKGRKERICDVATQKVINNWIEKTISSSIAYQKATPKVSEFHFPHNFLPETA